MKTEFKLDPTRYEGHTAGPWDYRHESIDPEWGIVCASGGNIVANVNSETGPDIAPCVSTKMPINQNARLIADAPAILALALEQAKEIERLHEIIEGKNHQIAQLELTAEDLKDEIEEARS